MAVAKSEDTPAETLQLFEFSIDDLAEKLKKAKAETQKIELEEQKRKQILELVQLQEENARRRLRVRRGGRGVEELEGEVESHKESQGTWVTQKAQCRPSKGAQ